MASTSAQVPSFSTSSANSSKSPRRIASACSLRSTPPKHETSRIRIFERSLSNSPTQHGSANGLRPVLFECGNPVPFPTRFGNFGIPSHTSSNLRRRCASASILRHGSAEHRNRLPSHLRIFKRTSSNSPRRIVPTSTLQFTSSEHGTFPSQIRIFKRVSRKASLKTPLPSPNLPRSSSSNLTEPLLSGEGYLGSLDCEVEQEQHLHSASELLQTTDPLQSNPPTTKAALRNQRTESENENQDDCTLCHSPLPRMLERYTFPKTAPAILHAVRRYYSSSNVVSLNAERPMTPKETENQSPTLSEALTHDASSIAPIFCLACFSEVHALQICWGCGKSVARAEERVGCGWAWWHWGCVSCLLCRVRPPIPPVSIAFRLPPPKPKPTAY